MRLHGGVGIEANQTRLAHVNFRKDDFFLSFPMVLGKAKCDLWRKQLKSFLVDHDLWEITCRGDTTS